MDPFYLQSFNFFLIFLFLLTFQQLKYLSMDFFIFIKLEFVVLYGCVISFHYILGSFQPLFLPILFLLFFSLLFLVLQYIYVTILNDILHFFEVISFFIILFPSVLYIAYLSICLPIHWVFFFFLSDKLLLRPASDFFSFLLLHFSNPEFPFSIDTDILYLMSHCHHTSFYFLKIIYYTLNMFTICFWLLCLLCLTSGPYLRQYLLPAFFPVYVTLFFFFFKSLSFW